jgi:hypothetical protein
MKSLKDISLIFTNRCGKSRQLATILLLTVLLLRLPIAGWCQAYPTNNSQNMNMNSQINYDLSAQYTVLMDPLYGYGANESTTNFSARNYWSLYTAANPNDENAWFNYYRSTRYIAEGSAGFRELQADLDSISSHLKRYSQGTWEQLIVEYWNSNRDQKKEVALKAAYALRPTDPITLRFMTGMEYLHGKSRSVYDYYVKWKATGELPLSTESYAYNVMQSIPADAILFTNGEMDTYPLLYQMQTIGANGVKIVSISLCNRTDNRSKIFSNAGLIVPDNDLSASIDGNYIARVAASNPTKKIYVASTCGATVLKQIQANLYCTGLAFRFSTTTIDHLTYLRDNVGVRFKLDNVGKPRASTNRFDVNYSASLEMNYYLPLLITADQYVQAGNPTRAAQLRAKAISIRQRAGYDEPIRSEE